MSIAYFDEDGSYCIDSYSISVTSPDPLPDWITFDGASFTVTSRFSIDAPVTQDVTISVDIDGATATGTFTAELVCDDDTFCDENYRMPGNLDPVDCDGNGPEFLTNF